MPRPRAPPDRQAQVSHTGRGRGDEEGPPPLPPPAFAPSGRAGEGRGNSSQSAACDTTQLTLLACNALDVAARPHCGRGVGHDSESYAGRASPATEPT